MLIETFNTFLGRLENVTRSSETQAVASCPAHDDKNPSLSIAIIPHKKTGKDTILVNCHAGCSFESIVQKVGVEPSDFFSGEDKKRFQKKKEKRYKAEIDEDGKVIFYSKTHQTKVREVERYQYFKEDGSLAFSVIRSHPKDFRPLQPDGHLDLNGIERIPYRLPELIKSIQSHETIFITEGEKDCDRGNEIGLSCTTFPSGTGKFQDEYSQYFKNAEVVFLPDNDKPGIQGAQKIAQKLSHSAKSVRILELPDLGPIMEHHGKDLSDWLDIPGNDAEKLKELAKSALRVTPPPIWLGFGKHGPSKILYAIASNCFCEQHKDSLIFHAETWWQWNSRIWVETSENLVRSIIREMLTANKDSLRLTSHTTIDDVYKQSKLILGTRDDFPGFNSKLNQIVLENGTLFLDKGEFQPNHIRQDFNTIMLPFKYDREAKCLRWLRFLNEIGLDNKTQNSLMQWFGYCLIPTAKIQKCLYLLGEGANGKSIILLTLRNLLGDQNCSALEMAELFDRFKVARLRNRLVNLGTDIETNNVLDARFKKLVSGEPQIAEMKHRDPFEFRPYAKLLFSANEFIPSRDRSYGFFRRFQIIRFERIFKESEQDQDLEETLHHDLPGIFNWALLGLKKLIDNEWVITESEAMRNAFQEFNEAVNPVYTWSEEKLSFNPELEIRADILRSNYAEWCDEHGHRVLSSTQLGKELKRLRPKIKKIRKRQKYDRGTYYSGVTIN